MNNTISSQSTQNGTIPKHKETMRCRTTLSAADKALTPERLARAAVGRVLKVGTISSALRDTSENLLNPINRMHGFLGLYAMEGFMRMSQAKFFQDLLIAQPEIKSVAEIGFNGGHSASVFLGARSDTSVLSFDLGEHDYVRKGQQYLGKKFQARHRLVLGDSTVTIPNYVSTHPNEKFDLVFIDGGHSYEVARADIHNMAHMAHPGSVVVMDDYLPSQHYGIGPVRAWDESLREGIVAQDAIVSGDGRTWAIGHYLQSN